jgi:hypothetical protein
MRLALGNIDELELQRQAEVGGDRLNLAGVGRWGKSVQLHVDLHWLACALPNA